MVDLKKYIVAVCAATGNQGRELVERFQTLNMDGGTNDANPIVHVRALTRDQTSKSAQTLLAVNPETTLVDVDYNCPDSIRESLQGADALYLNLAMSQEEASTYVRIVDAALQAGVKHIVYSSSMECQRDHKVPHWETSRHTEEYLKKKYEETGGGFQYHLLRYAHCNENLLSFMKPNKNGWMSFPWDPKVKIHTASVRDGVRVACKLFRSPTALESGAHIDVVTEYVSPKEMAQAIETASGKRTHVRKGPWIFIKFGHWFGWEASSIVSMGKRIEESWSEDYWTDKNGMEKFLKDEVQTEPLETIEAFARRHFSSSGKDECIA